MDKLILIVLLMEPLDSINVILRRRDVLRMYTLSRPGLGFAHVEFSF